MGVMGFDPADCRLQQQRVRAAGILARRTIPQELRVGYDAAICARLMRLASFQSARVILSYCPIPGEANVEAVNRAARMMGKRVAYPDCIDSTHMVASEPLDDVPWTVGRLQIPAPDRAHARVVTPGEIDFIIVPCAAFDAQCGRVGMGAGYYDRYLPLCTHACTCIAAYDEQRVAYIAREPHDYATDFVVTQSMCYEAGYIEDAQNAARNRIHTAQPIAAAEVSR